MIVAAVTVHLQNGWLAIAEGKLSLDDEVLKFFPDKAPAEVS